MQGWFDEFEKGRTEQDKRVSDCSSSIYGYANEVIESRARAFPSKTPLDSGTKFSVGLECRLPGLILTHFRSSLYSSSSARYRR